MMRKNDQKRRKRQPQWILAIADRGIIAYGEVYPTKRQAEQGLIDYLRKQENYDGPEKISEAANWVAEHDERLSVEIFAAESNRNSDDEVAADDTLNNSEQLQRFLADAGFIVLGNNQHDPHPDLPFEAWAYRGPLDLQSAVPVTFGQGSTAIEALTALNEQLSRSPLQEKTIRRVISHGIAPPPHESGPEPLWRVIYTIDVNASDARQAAWAVHEIMKDPDSWAPVLEVLDSRGNLTRIDLSESADERGNADGHG